MRRAILAIVATVAGLVLLLSFKPHEITAATDRPAAVSNPGTSDASSSSSDSVTGSGGSAKTTTVIGTAADTRWGPVQVQLVISNGKVTRIKVLQAPNSNHRDIEINDRALPVLNEEALAAQSAEIDTVSGATYTSEGYKESLQSALDQAGI